MYQTILTIIGSGVVAAFVSFVLSSRKETLGRHTFIGLALLALSHFAFTNVTAALAQAGSTGGTIGKQDKSISGGDTLGVGSHSATNKKPRHSVASSPNRASGETRGSSCGRIVGKWKMGLGQTAIINSDGTAKHSYAGTGRWTCKDGQYFFVWPNGITDHISVSSDGNSIEGSNSLGMSSAGTRF